ncbi:MAG: hypothetical protein IKP58_07310 [Victivallales bacterium]|nr:hypothetical protein [Victivallales bacterium]
MQFNKLFDSWTGDNVQFADANVAQTTFVMPANAVTPKALYKKVTTLNTLNKKR